MKNNQKYVALIILMILILISLKIRNDKRQFNIADKEIMLSDLRPGQTAILIKTTCPTCKKYKSKINGLLHNKLVYYADMNKQANIDFVKNNINEPVTVPSKIYFDEVNNQFIFTNEQDFIMLIN